MPWGAADHSLRKPMIAELHARPFLKLRAPARIAYIALKPEEDNLHSPAIARQQLLAFLDRYDAPHPDEEAVYYFVNLGTMTLKWENHSEFSTYTLFTYEAADQPFATDLHDAFDTSWITDHGSRVITSVSIELLMEANEADMAKRMDEEIRDWFGRASFAAALVTDKGAALAADFDLDADGHIRFAVLATPLLGPGRVGRVVQRLLEIETYRAMSMLTLPVARKVLSDLRLIDQSLSRTVEAMGAKTERASESLDELLKLSSDLAVLSSQSSFRFSAARAYETLVRQRLELLNEERLLGRQLLTEFMKRRYDPTMRTCRSASEQLDDMAERAAKAAELLGTRVSVTTSSQNRELLATMDKRAAQQARLQETVEGISVVAISYYAVSLLTYLLSPVAKMLELSKTTLAAALVLPVAALVWISMHRLKEKLIRKDGQEGH